MFEQERMKDVYAAKYSQCNSALGAALITGGSGSQDKAVGIYQEMFPETEPFYTEGSHCLLQYKKRPDSSEKPSKSPLQFPENCDILLAVCSQKA